MSFWWSYMLLGGRSWALLTCFALLQAALLVSGPMATSSFLLTTLLQVSGKARFSADAHPECHDCCQ